ncbi:MAG TPA: trimethylamine methyltransferase family protein, partial [Planctomycetota bacterium]|nr:trimethylamine methyltransferase family protein [Planctomycetota bacterium]
MTTNRDDIERIHETSLSLLADPGVRIEHDAIRERLSAAGAKAGLDAQVIRFPRELVAECLAQAPPVVHYADRRGGGYDVGGGRPTRVWSPPGLNLLRHGVHRPFASGDLADCARLLDALDSVDGVFGLALDDVPPGARDVVGLRILAANTTKHVRVLSFTPEGADALCAMKDAVSDGPWFSVGFTAHGPLRWTHLALEIFRRTAGRGIPVTVNGEPTAGASGPVTLAGSAAVGNAEILAGIVVNQVLEPGRPCVHNLGLAHTLDMKTAVAVTGGPENHLFAQLGAQLARLYNLPSCSWVSTESMCVDAQAALEKAFGFATHFDAGVSLVWGAGQLESEMTFSPAQAVIDDEMVAYVRRLERGVAVTDDTLALDLVREVGIGGSFLDAEHTLAHFRDALWEPGVLWRERRAKWSGLTLAERAETRAD